MTPFFRRRDRTAGTDVSPQQAAASVEGGALLLDVREQPEWTAGHAPSARHIPLGELPARIGELPADRPIVAVCRSGNRSARAAALLARSGRDAVNLEGGMHAWARSGLAIVTDTGAPGVVA